MNMKAKDMFPLNHWIKTHGDLALDLVRVYLGIGLIIKAIYFMNHSDELLNRLDSMGSLWFAPAILQHYIILAHVVGGICLLFGLFTRTAALIQLPVLLGALISAGGRESMEFTALVLFLLALFSVYGAGRWSLDHWLAKRDFEKLFEPDPHPVK